MDVKCAMALNEVMRIVGVWERSYWCRYTRYWADFMGSISGKKTLPVTAYRTDKWSNRKEGVLQKKTEDGVQVMVSQLEWTFRSRSAHNVSYSHHRHGGVTHKGQVTASARQNKKWASLQGDRSATSARTHTRLGAPDPSLFVHSLPPIGRCSEDDHTCSAYTDMRTEALMFLARTEEPKVAQSSLFPSFF